MELCFILQYIDTCKLSKHCLKNNIHVWTYKYNISFLLSWKFYYEYDAYVDREYMLKINNWNRVIEG